MIADRVVRMSMVSRRGQLETIEAMAESVIFLCYYLVIQTVMKIVIQSTPELEIIDLREEASDGVDALFGY